MTLDFQRPWLSNGPVKVQLEKIEKPIAAPSNGDVKAAALVEFCSKPQAFSRFLSIVKPTENFFE